MADGLAVILVPVAARQVDGVRAVILPGSHLRASGQRVHGSAYAACKGKVQGKVSMQG
jgi:hypothetical protein